MESNDSEMMEEQVNSKDWCDGYERIEEHEHKMTEIKRVRFEGDDDDDNNNRNIDMENNDNVVDDDNNNNNNNNNNNHGIVSLCTPSSRDIVDRINQETGKRDLFVPYGTPLGAKMVQDFENGHKFKSNHFTEEELHEMRLKHEELMIREFGIFVPATIEDEENPKILVQDIPISVFNGDNNNNDDDDDDNEDKTPSSSLENTKTMRAKLVIAQMDNDEHITLLYKQKKRRVYMENQDETETLLSIKESLDSKERIPYYMKPVQFTQLYRIRNIKKLSIDSHALMSLMEFRAATLRDIFRESCLLPIIIKTPNLLRMFYHSPMGQTVNSFFVMQVYLMVPHFLETAFPKMRKASVATKGLYHKCRENPLELLPSEMDYLEKWSIDDVMRHIYNRCNTPNKKSLHKYDHEHEISDLKIRKWAYYQRDKQAAETFDVFIKKTQFLIIAYAESMEIIGPSERDKLLHYIENEYKKPNNIDSSDINDDVDIKEEEEEEEEEEGCSRINIHDEFIETLKRISNKVMTNFMFLYDYFILILKYTQEYIHTQERFLLFQCHEEVPIKFSNNAYHLSETKRRDSSSTINHTRVWEDLVSVENIDPAFGDEYSDPPHFNINYVHLSIAANLEFLEKKVVSGGTISIRNMTKEVILERAERMGMDPDELSSYVDETPNIYHEICELYTVPTVMDLQNNLRFTVYCMHVTDTSEDYQIRKAMYDKTVNKMMAIAEEQGRKIILGYPGEPNGKRKKETNMKKKKKKKKKINIKTRKSKIKKINLKT
jgi:hypothetical protein